MRAAEFGTRVVILRTGMVLEADGGALAKMLLPFRLFAGGPIMPGNQWVSWIHRSDHIGLIQWALSTATVSGPINAVAPEPVTMNTFCEVLGRVLHRPSWLPVPGIALNILLGELGITDDHRPARDSRESNGGRLYVSVSNAGTGIAGRVQRGRWPMGLWTRGMIDVAVSWPAVAPYPRE